MELESIDHVAIVVNDLDESIKFYTEILGMELDRIVDVPDFRLRVAFVTKEGADVELMKYEDPSIPVGVRHICALVPDVPQATEELTEKGVEIVRPLQKTSLGFWFAMIRDPSGVTIEILDASHKDPPGAWKPQRKEVET